MLLDRHAVGSSCCRHTVNRMFNAVAQGTAKRLNDIVAEAIAQKWQIVLIIDDYTAIHTIRRPTTSQSCNPKSMCTIIVKLFRNVPAIPACPATNCHSLKALDIVSVVNSVSGPAAMHQLSQSYSSIMPNWIRNCFFNPEVERHRLSSHQYSQHDSVRTMRQMHDVYLVDFVELTLKSKDDFDAAIDIVLSTNLLEYLKHFLLPQPGDWHAQFYSRQVIYETLQKYCKHTEASSTPQAQPPQSSLAQAHSDHSYTLSYQSGPEKENETVNPDQPAILSLIPCIGPLHISLNGQETLFNEFRDFFEIIYTKLFPKSKLAKNPKPWRISLILEVVYGGWLYIRESVREKFIAFKDMEYQTLLNLLDNYLPLVLSIYSVTFKLNNFTEYFNAIVRIWTMFLCLQRHHYDKALLVWLSMCAYWGINNPALFEMLRSHLLIFDEYPVENAHSIIRSKTNPHDSVESLRKKAKAALESKHTTQVNFQEHFSKTSSVLFSQNQLVNLKAKCAKVIAQMLKSIATTPGKAVLNGTGKDEKVLLPRIFGKEPQKRKILPLGYQSLKQPSEKKRCDLPECRVVGDEQWTLLACSHSYHVSCLSQPQCCPLCQEFLKNKAQKLSEAAQNAILNPKSKNKDAMTQKQDRNHDGDDSVDVDDVDPDSIDGEIAALNQKIQSFPTLNPPPLHSPSIPSQTTLSQAEPQRQPSSNTNTVRHCQQCGHPCKGHKRPKSGPKQCPLCSGGICSPNIRPPQQHSNRHLVLRLTVACYNDVHEWLLPPEISQSTVFGMPLGSNACTMIAVIGAQKFLCKQLETPTHQNITRCVADFANTMREGNKHYDELLLPPNQPNLTPQEAINSRTDKFGLKIIEDTGLFSEISLSNKLAEICSHQQDHCAILITPPDKSMLLCFDSTNQLIILYESHCHRNNGGLIAVTFYANIHNLTLFLSHMCARDWGSTICGSNITTLAV